MAGMHDQLPDDPFAAVGRSELPLLHAPLDKQVVAFIEGQRQAGQLPVKGERVPVGVLLDRAL